MNEATGNPNKTTATPSEQCKNLIQDFTGRMKGFSPDDTLAVGRAWLDEARDQGVPAPRITNLVTDVYNLEHVTK